jgi:polysaccharide export outer membrane protein
MRNWFVLAMITLWVAVPGWAEQPTRYRFAPGDVIEVTVTPQQNFNHTITVQPDGKISFPIVGELQAAGLTVEQFTEKLRKGLSRDLVGPQVSVSLKDLNKQAVLRVSLLGAVRTPGVFEMKDGITLAEVLASAGGPLPLADLRRITITRADRSVTTVNLAESGKTGQLQQNLVLQPGDLIVVPEGAPPTVLVLGQVTKPGAIEIKGETRLLDALSVAGGPTTKANLRRLTLARPGVSGTQTLDLHGLLLGEQVADAAWNVVLQPGDTIVVPETEELVYVLGRVSRPDTYPIRPNDRILDALIRAGGATSDGDNTTAVLVRRDGTGQPVAKPLDLKKIMAKGDLVENDLLRPGDVLFVPDKKIPRSPTGLTDLLWPLTGLLRILR